MAVHSNFTLSNSDLIERFCDLDDDLLSRYGLSRHFDMTIVGSGALILLGVVAPERRTTDIDVLEAPDELLSLLELYNMNTMVSTFLYTQPQTWHERKQELRFEGACLSVYTLSLEDLTIMKLLAFRKQDQDDLIDIVKSESVDWIILDALINEPTELRINMDSENDWLEFLGRYSWLQDKRKQHI